MKKFNFKYDSVKRVREINENLAMKQLRDIEKEIENLKTRIGQLQEKLAKSYSERSGVRKIAEMLEEQNYRDFLAGQIENLFKTLDEFEKKRMLAKKQLEERTKESKMMEKLEEKHLEEFTIDSNRSEMKDFNEIALLKFGRE